MKNFAKTLIPLFVLSLLVSPLAAQEEKYRFEVFGGGNLPFDKDFLVGYPQAENDVSGTHEFKTGFQGGARIGVDGHRHWGMDYAYSYGENNSKIVTPYGSFAIKNRIHHASANTLFYPFSLAHRAVLPYVTAGIGAMFVTIPQKNITQAMNPLQAGIGEIKSETVAAFNAGAGIRFRLSERWGVRLDVRDYMSRPLNYGLPKTSSDPNQAVLPVSGVFHQVAFTFGVVVHF